MAFSPEAFAKMLRAIESDVKTADPQQMHLDVGDEFRLAQEGNFERAENENGVQWPPRKRHYPHPILRKTRKMLGAASTWGAAGNIHRSDGRRLTLGISGTGVHYAKYHQYGTRNKDGSVRLPVRQFFYFRKADKPDLKPPIKRHLLNVFNRTKGRHRGR